MYTRARVSARAKVRGFELEKWLLGYVLIATVIGALFSAGVIYAFLLPKIHQIEASISELEVSFSKTGDEISNLHDRLSLIEMNYTHAFRRITTITGKYSYIGNPCINSPCLPGMVHSISKDDQYYLLTVNGIWLYENFSWEGYLPKEGDLVTVVGYLSMKRDIKGKYFYEIEIISLVPINGGR